MKLIGVTNLNISKIGILGAGVMGPGIAEVFAIFGASHNFNIFICDISPIAIKEAIQRLKEDLVKVGTTGLYSEEDLAKAKDRITFTTKINDIYDSDLIIEAVPENLELKKKIFHELDRNITPTAIIATNSSGLSITEISSNAIRPERCIGTHFMNPPILMPLVEVVNGNKTSKKVTKTVMSLLREVNKQPVLVKKDIPGYVHNRLQAAVFRELMYLVDQDVMSIVDLEMTVRYGLGLRLPIMKVFEMVDLMGIDTIFSVLSYLYPSLARSTEPPAFLKDMITKGTLGVKSQKGFHDYRDYDMQQSMTQKQIGTFQLLMLMQQFD